MEHSRIDASGKQADGYVIDLGGVNLVMIKTDQGLIACGAIDVAVLDKFKIPAARISGVATIDDLLNGTIKEANQHAQALGITAGMTGREAAERL